MAKSHIPVMLDEAVSALELTSGDRVIDATLGLGGHALHLLEAIGPTGRLLGIERSQEGLTEARERLTNYQAHCELLVGDFRDLAAIAHANDFDSVAAILFDLGLASWQINEGHLGLSYRFDTPLDMRLGPYTPQDRTRKVDDPSNWTGNAALARTVRTWRFQSAADFIGGALEEELSNVFRALGDATGARSLARRIIEYRAMHPIQTSFQLVEAAGTTNPERLAPLFQALRILVNDEFGALMAGLEDAWSVLGSGGRLVVISFHSGEDRIVKHFLKSLPDAQIELLKRPSDDEVKQNSRSRSAILRSARKL